MRRATLRRACVGPLGRCFNSRPSCDGRREVAGDRRGLSAGFNSRPSCDGRQERNAIGEFSEFQFTPVVRRATFCNVCNCVVDLVSIHARRATGDTARPAARRASKVSIHARRATGDFNLPTAPCACLFQFTPVVRRATSICRLRPAPVCFNSRPSCDGRLLECRSQDITRCFNSRPSCDGRQRRERHLNSLS